MSITIHPLRSFLIALVALAMSASLTLGAAAPQSSFGQITAASQAGNHAGSGDEETVGEDEETEEDEDAEEAEGDGGENCATDPTDPETDLESLTHGQIVCWAAHQETPEGYRNHGAWVSSWARGEMTAVTAIAAFGLIVYGGLIDKPGEPSGLIGLKWGWLVALAGTILMLVGSALRASEVERARKPPGVL